MLRPPPGHWRIVQNQYNAGIVSASDVATSRFANNEMTQNQAPNVVSVSVRVIVDRRQARLSTDRVSPSAIPISRRKSGSMSRMVPRL